MHCRNDVRLPDYHRLGEEGKGLYLTMEDFSNIGESSYFPTFFDFFFGTSYKIPSSDNIRALSHFRHL